MLHSAYDNRTVFQGKLAIEMQQNKCIVLVSLCLVNHI